MDLDESCVDVGSVSEADAQLLQTQCWDVLQLRVSLESQPSGENSATCIVHTVLKPNLEQTFDDLSERSEGYVPAISISPLMYQIMCTAAVPQPEAGANQVHSAKNDDGLSESWFPANVAPLQVPSALAMLNDEASQHGTQLTWAARRLGEAQDLPLGSSIKLDLVFIEDELLQFCQQGKDFTDALQSTLAFFLGGRIVMEGTLMVVYAEEGMAIAAVKQIDESASDSTSEIQHSSLASPVYRLGVHGEFTLVIEHEDCLQSSEDALESNHNSAGSVEWMYECPGYDGFVQSLVQLTSMSGPAAPSGVLLTGSPQVGKTHLASCAAYHLYRTSALVHWVSVQNLLLQATWASESDLISMLRPPRNSPNQVRVLILDDLQIFATEGSSLHEDSVTLIDPELLVVNNAVLQIIDEIAMHRVEGEKGASILGIARSSSSLPFEFVKSGRLEKEIAMLPPTESQREMILRDLLSTLTADCAENAQVVQYWAQALTPVTVGCVAGDLRRILANAWARSMARGEGSSLDNLKANLTWDDLRIAAQTYIPIQLETVDVCKPRVLSLASTETSNASGLKDLEDWADIHKFSWENFGGYPMVKNRLLRTVVGPWRRFLKSVDTGNVATSPTSSMGLSPPPGVLFHGPSGNGKSLAAVCLATSLGLPMIKVRAADVMDKWLGGSEAIIRSLFARARAAAPCVLFFDELDSIATNRASGDEGGAEVMSRLLSTLLNEMDGISSDRRRQSVLVVACTNRLEDLDAALLRPGRLEEHVHLTQPDAGDIGDILRIHLSKVPLSPEIDLDALAQELADNGASGAEVEGLCHEACLRAVDCATATDVLLTADDMKDVFHSSC